MLTLAVNYSSVSLTQLNNNGCMMAADKWGIDQRATHQPYRNLSTALDNDMDYLTVKTPKVNVVLSGV
jgi:hypothetical protein